MADLTTPTGIEAELSATARYDVDRDVDMAKRRVAALRRKLDFAVSSSRDGQSLTFQHQVIQSELQSCLAFVRANETVTDAQLLANPSVLHADFSTFGPYTGGSEEATS